ncbi:MAG: isochorismatase family protein [Bdellovibrionales bacterium]|jgi:nicotinamidase-related amidase
MKNAFDAVHLAIDIQSCFYKSLPKSRVHNFTHAARIFANRLREHNILTIWVAFGSGHEPPFTFAPQEPKERTPFVQKLGLEAVRPKENEPIYIKLVNDAFYYEHRSPLKELLQSKNCRNVIITGMNTGACVSDTIIGAQNVGLNVYAIYDLMADNYCEKQPNAPGWHKEKLMNTCDGIHKVHLSPRDDFLRHLKEKGMLPPMPQPKGLPQRLLQKVVSYASLR